ncbi:MAG TPA: bifunctional diaminohydroxyphosphoribosylaminopyrimidine deaminase/5-amino-6-(5-phosphoribosylamino)uracil reductase RibD [Jiangellaceae bacterium]|nr:bifunctional diaminohydroxyphosphoribosylaminopyrimidine deaminase/5-amino-6-(5-phosphoribosylamino)uracil reductase RibD [Jiangellaceae bacterium]
MATVAEVTAMRRAIAHARRGSLTTPPNPDVGCIVLDSDGQIAGEGYHERAGQPHAEVHALSAAGDRARGGTAVVSLEPCNHTGRTEPCVQALVGAGVARVVYAVADPDPVAAGGGAALRSHGVDVEGSVLEAEASQANARWLLPLRQHRPFVVWKVATTLDGRTAAVDGTSRWITGPQARAEVHQLRRAVDTVVVGVGTVVADDPQLTARDEDGNPRPREHQPLRVVVDTQGRTPRGSRVLDETAPTWVATSAEVGGGVDGVDLSALLARLYEQRRSYVLLEGGASLAAAFWRSGLVDRTVAYLAPALLGAGAPALADIGITTIDDIVRLEHSEFTTAGADICLTATRRI